MRKNNEDTVPFNHGTSKKLLKIILISVDLYEWNRKVMRSISLCSPMIIPNGAKCKVFLRNKSDVYNAFREIKALVENQTGKKIKQLQSDNEREYLSTEFEDFLAKAGIRRRLSIAYNPEQNGIAERKNQTLLKMTRCLLIRSDLPSSFWAEAVSTANYIRNRCPTDQTSSRIELHLNCGLERHPT